MLLNIGQMIDESGHGEIGTVFLGRNRSNKFVCTKFAPLKKDISHCF